MRRRVVAAAHEMGYSGQRLRRAPGATGNLGVLVTDRLLTSNLYYTDLYRSLVLESGKQQYTCIMEIVSPQLEQACAQPAFVSERKVDGIVFMGQMQPAYLRAVAAVGLPCLTLDFRLPGAGVASVVRDEFEGGLLLTGELVRRGCRSVGFAGDAQGSYNAAARFMGWRCALDQQGLAFRPEWVLMPAGQPNAPALPDALPDAWLCESEQAAFHLANALRACGPAARQPALACFYDLPQPPHLLPGLTLYQVDAQRLAGAAVQRMLRLLRQKDADALHWVVPGCLREPA